MKTHKYIPILLLLVFAGSFSGLAQENSLKKVRISTSQPGAILSIDGELIGHTPREVSLSYGYHQILIIRYGYVTLSTEIFVNNITKKFNFKLVPAYTNPRKDNLINIPGNTSIPKYQKYKSNNYIYYKKKAVPWVIVGAISGAAATIFRSSANRRYETYKLLYHNKEGLKKEIQTLDRLTIASLSLFAVSTYFVIHYTLKSRNSKYVDISLIPSPTGGLISLNYTIH